ncbi:MAG: diacylglycerol O-acyltransferase / wax synthase [Frankiaceae bacterium]|jgi:WS/DGAT/MGAT family acyltransferase|nr:diacylglycerol O-acyltransferase / wax synthase [Frankiaceae bacterium]MDQ1650389.1 diacylglycerol O-acyltransferase / wax synthase [Frankiaceae bacterium]MDQ1673440.1 diacylglycerol O-acyltransferase / wax synthase [Frankiaceae bacterium]
MSQQHLDRLSSVDAGFLHQEDGRDSHMHIGGIGIFEGPAPDEQSLLDHIGSRLKLVPRFRQKLVAAPLSSGRPMWADDVRFNLNYHVRRTALPRPGNELQLRRLISRVHSQRLDRTKPLWEMWIVEGLADDRWAVLTKTHHALVDGVGGIDIMTALLDLSPESREVGPDDWRAAREPGFVDLVGRGVSGAARNITEVGGKLLGRAFAPRQTAAEAVERVLGLADMARMTLSPAPPTPLNRTPGPHRDFAFVREPIAEAKAIKDALGGTLNDVVLAVVSGALRRFLDDLGCPVDSMRLRACVPMSVRTSEQASASGNRIVIMVAELPIDIADPVARLHQVSEHMTGLKSSRQAVAAETMIQMEQWMPPNVLAQATRLGFSSRLYNLLVTNVPGPQFPVYLLGRRMLEVFPIAFLAPEHTLAVAILSYDGSLSMGLLSDADADHDLPGLVGYIDDAVTELLDAAGITRETPAEPPASAGRGQRTATARKASPRKTSPRKAGGRAGRRP